AADREAREREAELERRVAEADRSVGELEQVVDAARSAEADAERHAADAGQERGELERRLAEATAAREAAEQQRTEPRDGVQAVRDGAGETPARAELEQELAHARERIELFSVELVERARDMESLDAHAQQLRI